MLNKFKGYVKSVLPMAVTEKLRQARYQIATREFRRAFSRAIAKNNELDSNEFNKLRERYPIRQKTYGYDQQSRDVRAESRAKHLLSLSDACGCHRFLELGCGDAMTSCMLARQGKVASAVDITPCRDFNEKTADGVDARALGAGVEYRQLDASCLDYSENSFDFVFSYNAFEHFSDPKAVLTEAHRVTRISGKVYLSFGPLYYSPFGAHSTWIIAIPYFRLLFTDSVLDDYLKTHDLGIECLTPVNAWSLKQYQDLWREYSSGLRVLSYREKHDLSALNLVKEYAPWLKTKTDHFDELTTSQIEILLEKTASTFAG